MTTDRDNMFVTTGFTVGECGKSPKVASARVVESSGTFILEFGIIPPLEGTQGFLKLIAEHVRKLIEFIEANVYDVR